MKLWLCPQVINVFFPVMKFLTPVFLFITILAFGGCATVKVDPIEVKPIHITVDVNVKVEVDKALDDFFGDIDKKSSTIAKPAMPANP